MSKKKIKAPRPKSAVKKERIAAQIKEWKLNAAKRKKIKQLIDDYNTAEECGIIAEMKAAEKEKANAKNED
jgi:hypothetical protein